MDSSIDSRSSDGRALVRCSGRSLVILESSHGVAAQLHLKRARRRQARRWCMRVKFRSIRGAECCSDSTAHSSRRCRRRWSCCRSTNARLRDSTQRRRGVRQAQSVCASLRAPNACASVRRAQSVCGTETATRALSDSRIMLLKAAAASYASGVLSRNATAWCVDCVCVCVCVCVCAALCVLFISGCHSYFQHTYVWFFSSLSTAPPYLPPPPRSTMIGPHAE